ncbi:MAG: hypothetical protein OQJ89_10515 [Kangiellaceae bacterium]|nr:hypothetical protein [Kangiellaceae bacterium]MCW8999118.1 hypothetical protein [Kangiellaceae bacterium]MCW9017388.1 hypothetical protein [Kangiellaceae bacterium]
MIQTSREPVSESRDEPLHAQQILTSDARPLSSSLDDWQRDFVVFFEQSH